MILIVAMSLFMNLFCEQIRVYLLRLLTPKKKKKRHEIHWTEGCAVAIHRMHIKNLIDPHLSSHIHCMSISVRLTGGPNDSQGHS